MQSTYEERKGFFVCTKSWHWFMCYIRKHNTGKNRSTWPCLRLHVAGNNQVSSNKSVFQWKLWLIPESTVYGLSHLRGDAIDSNASVDPLCAQGLSELYHPSFGCVIGQLLLWVWHYWEGHSTFKTYEEHFYQFSVILTLYNSEIPLSEIVKLTWVYFIY